MYYQCSLSQGTGRTHGYIEARGAKVGARVELHGHEGLWTVDQVSDKGLTVEKLREKQSMDRNAFGSIIGN